MALMEQLSVSLKNREIDTWNKLKDIYPNRSKHDIILFAISSLLNKNMVRRSSVWKRSRILYPNIKNDWLFIKKVLEERLDESYNH